MQNLKYFTWSIGFTVFGLVGGYLLGGWPAAWLAQQVLRHKTIKRSFQAMFWLTVLVNVAALAVWVLWPVFNPEPPPPPPEPWQ